MKQNKLSLNTDKTNFILFHGNLSIKFNNKKIDNVKYLSMHLDISSGICMLNEVALNLAVLMVYFPN